MGKTFIAERQHAPRYRIPRAGSTVRLRCLLALVSALERASDALDEFAIHTDQPRAASRPQSRRPVAAGNRGRTTATACVPRRPSGWEVGNNGKRRAGYPPPARRVNGPAWLGNYTAVLVIHASALPQSTS